ncbi:hypothetical protein AB0D38_23990 [Streptomyces sp. NPDC048279]|uniref:hypothetical protein n=1 Tax=Streptomyces sp. NPDC048279 TaxID=3154714 RepID=UPI003447789F
MDEVKGVKDFRKNPGGGAGGGGGARCGDMRVVVVEGFVAGVQEDDLFLCGPDGLNAAVAPGRQGVGLGEHLGAAGLGDGGTGVGVA